MPRKRPLTELREAVELARKHVGCGDSACRFTLPRTRGMTTNGGCMCAARPFSMPALANLYRVAAKIVEETDE